jgi:hypothetical protein
MGIGAAGANKSHPICCSPSAVPHHFCPDVEPPKRHDSLKMMI